jgi:DNA-binding CsgD family transcriptional regulator
MESSDELVVPVVFGNHLHYVGQKRCEICEEENEAWDALMSQFVHEIGNEKKFFAYEAESWLRKQPAVKAHNQRMPYDQWAEVASLEDNYIEDGVSVFNPVELTDVEQAYADREATEELLAPLSATQRDIMEKTAAGYGPKEIAVMKGHKNSATVRIGKYKAKRALGVPINEKMRRQKNGE